MPVQEHGTWGRMQSRRLRTADGFAVCATLVDLCILTSIKERECDPAVLLSAGLYLKKAQPLLLQNATWAMALPLVGREVLLPIPPLVVCRPNTQTQKWTKRVTSRERRILCEHSTSQIGLKGQTMTTSEPFDFAKYRRPQFEGPIHELAESDGGTQNLGELLGRVSKNSTGEIDNLIGEFEHLRGKLQTDGKRIQREIEEYNSLSQQVMQLTKVISESMEKVRASVDRPTTIPR